MRVIKSIDNLVGNSNELWKIVRMGKKSQNPHRHPNTQAAPILVATRLYIRAKETKEEKEKRTGLKTRHYERKKKGRTKVPALHRREFRGTKQGNGFGVVGGGCNRN